MKYLLLGCLLLLVSGVAHAAKVRVTWQNPLYNETYIDSQGNIVPQSPLIDLAYVRLEWGTCNGEQFGVMQASITILTTTAGAAMEAFAYPSGLAKVCVRAAAVNAAGKASAYSNVSSKVLLPTPGKPVTLGQPVILNFIQP